MKKIGLFYGSTDGTTHKVAQKVRTHWEEKIVLHDVSMGRKEEIQQYDILILATSTWDVGKLQEDWDIFIDLLADTNLDGKKISFIGTGDAIGYPDTFVDGIGLIYHRIKNKGCTFFGKWPSKGYSFFESLGEIDDHFVGLVIDEVNQAGLSDERISAWVEQIKGELRSPIQ